MGAPPPLPTPQIHNKHYNLVFWNDFFPFFDFSIGGYGHPFLLQRNILYLFATCFWGVFFFCLFVFYFFLTHKNRKASYQTRRLLHPAPASASVASGFSHHSFWLCHQSKYQSPSNRPLHVLFLHFFPGVGWGETHVLKYIRADIGLPQQLQATLRTCRKENSVACLHRTHSFFEFIERGLWTWPCAKGIILYFSQQLVVLVYKHCSLWT